MDRVHGHRFGALDNSVEGGVRGRAANRTEQQTLAEARYFGRRKMDCRVLRGPPTEHAEIAGEYCDHRDRWRATAKNVSDLPLGFISGRHSLEPGWQRIDVRQSREGRRRHLGLPNRRWHAESNYTFPRSHADQFRLVSGWQTVGL